MCCCSKQQPALQYDVAAQASPAEAVRPAPENLIISHIQNVNVCPQPRVVGKIVAGIVRIVVDYDVVGVPSPVIDVDNINRSNAEVEAAKPEAIRPATFNPPHVTGTEFTGKTTVLPRMIQVIARIVPAFIVPNPLIITIMDMGRLGVALPVIELAVVRGRLLLSMLRRLPWGLRRTVRWNVSTTNFWTARRSAMLAATTMLLAATTVLSSAASAPVLCNHKT